MTRIATTLAAALVIAAASLTGCTPQNVEPGGNPPPPSITPAKFCADARVIDDALHAVNLSPKAKGYLDQAEAVLWPSGTTGCNANPLPDHWDVATALPMGIALANLLLAK
ncbi:MAG: hypothetical protein JSS23_11250, partial [Proteobacteria bacterium]|nr:hypothetical protein [Pseudomonadota bacterium]